MTVIDTLATSYLSSSSVHAGGAAEIAASRKEDKYVALSSTYNFVPIALETLGPIGARATSFLHELSRRMTLARDDVRETAHLFQWLCSDQRCLLAEDIRHTA